MNKTGMRKCTKICSIRSCKYSIGTREEIQMFCVPRDPSKLKQWCDSAGLNDEETLRGFVCIEHFEDDQLTNSKYRRLKSCAIPTIFNEVPGKNNDQYEVKKNDTQNSNVIICNATECIDLQNRCHDLEIQFSKSRSTYDISVAKMQAKIECLEKNIHKQNTELKSLRSSKLYAQKKKDELISTNKQLSTKIEHDEESIEFCKVCIILLFNLLNTHQNFLRLL